MGIPNLCDRRASSAGSGGLFTRELLDQAYEPYGYVAHALGRANGWSYTNSLEAFRESYSRGFRLFEVDLVLLGDGSIVAAHNRFESYYGLSKRFWRARVDEVSPKFRGTLTTLFERDLVRLLAEHTDVHLILDCKGSMHARLAMATRLVAVAREQWGGGSTMDADSRVVARMIPHFARRRELEALRDEFPFSEHMLALYRARWLRRDERALRFVARNSVRAVMMRWGGRYTPVFDAGLREAGAVTYVHGLAAAADTVLDDLRDRGVGVYTDRRMGRGLD